MVYGVLGPSGTFSEQAGYIYWGKEVDIYTAHNIPELFTLVEDGIIEGALVPIENSLAGSIKPTMESLESNRVSIAGEISIPIKQHLMGRQKYRLDEIELLISQPTALMQCEKFVQRYLPGVRTEITDSTARAAQILLDEKRKAVSIGNRQAAGLYGLEIICADIADSYNNTRFIHICREKMKSYGNKASLIFSLPDIPGALYQALGVFAKHEINMTKIESRPGIGEKSFSFYVELDMKPVLSDAREVMAELRNYCTRIKYLGSYAVMSLGQAESSSLSQAVN